MGSKNKRNKIWVIISIIMFCVSIIMLYKGYDKIANYSSPKESSLFPDGYYGGTNAYVGGDAYNYIINSGYSTGFFVLSSMFFISGFACIIIYYLSGENEDKLDIEQKKIDDALKF